MFHITRKNPEELRLESPPELIAQQSYCSDDSKLRSEKKVFTIERTYTNQKADAPVEVNIKFNREIQQAASVVEEQAKIVSIITP